jgi:hypothetical protein
MIEITLFLFVVLQLFFFIKNRKEITSYSYFIPGELDLKRKYFLVPNLDIETIPLNKLLDSILSYREIIDRNNPLTDLTKEEIDKNYKIITCLTLSSTSKSIHFLPTMRSINSYLLKNRDSLLDSSTIKEMIHKSSMDLYESVLKSIKIPSYLGFLGTFSILILGTFTISMQTQEVITINDIVLRDILNTFAYSLLSSGIGLSLTIFSSLVTLKNAKYMLNQNTNNFYSFIQTDLLPSYYNNYSEGLSSFEASLLKFTQDFSNNVKHLHESNLVNHQALLSQQKVLDSLEKMDPEKIAKAGLSFFNELDKNSDSIQQLANQFSNLNSFVELTTNLFTVAEKTFSKFSNFEGNFEKIANTIHLRLEESGKLLEFLGSHLSTLEIRRDDMQSVIISTDTILKESYKELTNSEREILYSFKETSLRSAEEYKKILQDYNRQSKEISLSLLDTLKTMEGSISDLTEREKVTHPSVSMDAIQKAKDEAFLSSLKNLFSEFETRLQLIDEKSTNREIQILNALQNIPSLQHSVTQQSLYPEAEFQKLLTQVNLNQIYFENILKELLKELRGESQKSKGLSFFGFVISKIQNIFR